MPCFTCSILSFSEAGNLRLKLNGLGNVNEALALLCTGFISSRIIWVSSEIEFPVPIQAAAAPRADKSVIPGQRMALNT